ncbi:ESCRT II complex subunit Dot2 [Friedmanniomyces endolithicus]|nr:ESCRT II complex subunit Dot2 [Friedmanniomyces endolithicus]
MASNRRGVGLSAFTNAAIASDQYARHGQALRTSHAEALANQLSVFQAALHNFSLTHAKDIRSNPTFRAEFARMCNAIGVDPLAGSNVKGAGGSAAGGKGSVWAKMLGSSVNDFYFELGVRVVEVCRETRGENGGMIAVAELQKRVTKGRAGLVGGGMEVTDDDVLRAIESLEPLGGMFKLQTLGGSKFVRSVPKELNKDQATVLEVIQVLSYVTMSMLQANLDWERARAIAVMDDLVPTVWSGWTRKPTRRSFGVLPVYTREGEEYAAQSTSALSIRATVNSQDYDTRATLCIPLQFRFHRLTVRPIDDVHRLSDKS